MFDAINFFSFIKNVVCGEIWAWQGDLLLAIFQWRTTINKTYLLSLLWLTEGRRKFEKKSQTLEKNQKMVVFLPQVICIFKIGNILSLTKMWLSCNGRYLEKHYLWTQNGCKSIFDMQKENWKQTTNVVALQDNISIRRAEGRQLSAMISTISTVDWEDFCCCS